MAKNNNAFAGVIIILVIIAAFLVLTHQNMAAQSGSNQLAIQLTDPPQLPAGVQSLTISYSSLAVHTTGSGGAGWINSNSSGSVDLLSIINFTQTIGAVSIPNGTKVNMVAFNITSASLVLNGTSYNVTLPQRHFTANVTSNGTANGSSSVQLSISPTVVALLTSNSTVFVMVPSLKAVIVPQGTNQSTLRVGFKTNLKTEVKEKLDELHPNITITNTSLGLSGNATTFSVTVKNNGNQSVTIKHIALFGNISATINQSVVDNQSVSIENEIRSRLTNGTICANVTSNTTVNNTVVNVTNVTNSSVNDRPLVNISNSTVVVPGGVCVGVNGTSCTNSTDMGYGQNKSGNESSKGKDVSNSDFGELGASLQSRYGLQINSSVCSAPGLQKFESEVKNRVMNTSHSFGEQHVHFKVVNFLISSNGTMILPYNTEDFNDTGYSLAAGQSYTFSFSGAIVTSDGGIVITPVSGSSYNVVVGGENDASASANVTAG